MRRRKKPGGKALTLIGQVFSAVFFIALLIVIVAGFITIPSSELALIAELGLIIAIAINLKTIYKTAKGG